MSNLTIGFGLVNVPIKTSLLVGQRERPKGRMLCPDHKEPIKLAYRCEHGDHYVDETASGFPAPDGVGFVTVDKSDIVIERTGHLNLDSLVDAGSVEAAYLGKAYLVEPQKGAEAAFDTLVAALRKTGKVAVAHGVLSDSTQLLVFREAFGCLLMHVCHYDAQVRHASLEKARATAEARPAPPKEHVAMAAQLLETLAGRFDPAEVEDVYGAALVEAIAVAAGTQERKPAAKVEAPAEVGDLMAALTASVERAKKTVAKKAPAKKPRQKVAA